MSNESDRPKSLIQRVREAAEDNGIALRMETPDDPPETVDEAAVDLLNGEWVAEDLETGETARGESSKAAWANLRGVPKTEIHNELARWHDER